MFSGDWSYALLMLKSGRRVRRQTWAGWNEWIALAVAGTFALDGIDGRLPLGPFLVMKTAAPEGFTPWHASQVDLLAADWEEAP